MILRHRTLCNAGGLPWSGRVLMWEGEAPAEPVASARQEPHPPTSLAGLKSCPTLRRRAYTLLEMSVVVALILVISALTIPSITSLFVDARANASADMICARMADARSLAMEQGKPYRFGFVPGTGKFQIAADDSPLWDIVQESNAVDDSEQIRGELLQDVIFGAAVADIGDNSTPSPGSSWQLGGVFLADGTGRGIVNPDGTSSDDVVFYFGKAGFSPMGVRLRGLTGAVRIFDPTAPEEQP